MPFMAPERWFNALEHVESGGDPNAVSPKGARGVMQVMPTTARGMGYDPERLNEPDYGRMVGRQYAQQMADRYGGNLTLASYAYNAGPGRVDRWLAGKSSLPAETIDYGRKVATAMGPTFNTPDHATSSMVSDQQDAESSGLVRQLLMAHPELAPGAQQQQQPAQPLGGPVSPGAPELHARPTGILDELVQWAREQGLEPDSSLPRDQQIAQLQRTATQYVGAMGGIGGGGEGETPTDIGATGLAAEDVAGEAIDMKDQQGADAPAPPAPPPPDSPPGGAPPPSQPPPINLPPTAAEVPHQIPEMHAAARATPLTPEEFNSIEIAGDGDHSLIKYPIDSMQLLRMHFYGIAKGDEFMQAADTALKSGAPEDVAHVQALQDDLLNNVLPRWEAAWHQQGLGLRMGRELKPESDYLREMRDLVNQDAPMTTMLKGLTELPTPEQRAEMLRQAAAGGSRSLLDNVLGYYVESLLSFNTVAKKAATDAWMTTFAFPERFVAEQMSRVARGLGAAPESTIAPGETQAMFVGLKDGMADAVKLAYQAAREDRNPLDPGVWGPVGFGEASRQLPLTATGTPLEGTYLGSGVDLLGHFVHLPARGILTTDVFAKAVNQQMEFRALLYRRAYRQAVASGLDGDEFGELLQDGYDKLLAKPPPGLVQQSIQRAQLQTMAQKLDIHPEQDWTVGKLAQSINDMRNSSALAKCFLPFWPTLVNLSRRALEFGGPLGLLSRTMRDQLMSGGPDRYLAMSRMALSSLMLTALWEHLHGSAPANPATKQLWTEQGNQPYSLGVGNYDIGNLPEPISGTLQMMADIKELSARVPWDDASRLGAAGLMVMSREMDDSAALKNFTSLLHILNGGATEAKKAVAESRMAEEMSPEQQQAAEQVAAQGPDTGVQEINKALQQYAGTVVPSSVANLAHGVDPIHRQVNGLIDEIKSRTPGWSKSLPPEYDLFGKPALTPLGWNRYVGNQISLFRGTEVKSDPVVKELVTLSPTVPVLGHDGMLTVGESGAMEKIPVTPQQVAEVNRLRGTLKDPDTGLDLHGALEKLIDSDEYAKGDAAGRRTALMRTITAYTAYAKATLLKQNPDLVKGYIDIRQHRAALRGSPGPLNLGAP